MVLNLLTQPPQVALLQVLLGRPRSNNPPSSIVLLPDLPLLRFTEFLLSACQGLLRGGRAGRNNRRRMLGKLAKTDFMRGEEVL